MNACARQQGAAAVYGLFLSMASAAALFFMFNTGQLVREKTQLVNATDAVAYSGGVMHARSLNYLAYINRSFIANEVLVAQTVSLRSWTDYLQKWQDNLGTVHPECYSSNAYAMALGVAFKYDLRYGVACWLLAFDTAGVTAGANMVIRSVGSAVLGRVAVSQLALQAAQGALMNVGMSPLSRMSGSRQAVLQDIANKNFPSDSRGVRVIAGLDAGLPDDWLGFAEYYGKSGTQRQRLKTLVLEAANDGFVRHRRWTSNAILPIWCVLSFEFNHVLRRGGTELLGFDEWHAADTQAWIHRWEKHFWWGGLSCRRGERATGYAADEAVYRQQNDSLSTYGGARTETPATYRSIAKNTSPTYIGLPGFYELSQERIGKTTEPQVVRFGVRLERDVGQLRVTDGSSQVKQGQGSLAIFETQGATSGRGKAMHAVAISEVYYQNPNPGHTSELANLFQPYWRVRLIPATLAQKWVPLGVGALNTP